MPGIKNTNMAKLKITGKDLRALGYPEAPVISVAMNVMEKNYRHSDKGDVIGILKAIFASPQNYINDKVLGPICNSTTSQGAGGRCRNIAQ